MKLKKTLIKSLLTVSTLAILSGCTALSDHLSTRFERTAKAFNDLFPDENRFSLEEGFNPLLDDYSNYKEDESLLDVRDIREFFVPSGQYPTKQYPTEQSVIDDFKRKIKLGLSGSTEAQYEICQKYDKYYDTDILYLPKDIAQRNINGGIKWCSIFIKNPKNYNNFKNKTALLSLKILYDLGYLLNIISEEEYIRTSQYLLTLGVNYDRYDKEDFSFSSKKIDPTNTIADVYFHLSKFENNYQAESNYKRWYFYDDRAYYALNQAIKLYEHYFKTDKSRLTINEILLLGHYYYEGVGGLQPNLQKALYYYNYVENAVNEKYARTGTLDSLSCEIYKFLAALYYEGEIVTKDHNKAREYFKRVDKYTNEQFLIKKSHISYEISDYVLLTCPTIDAHRAFLFKNLNAKCDKIADYKKDLIQK